MNDRLDSAIGPWTRGLLIALCAWMLLAGRSARAENPIIQTNFTADPAPLVHNGVVYLYTSHDEDDARGFKMRDWRLYTSSDMSNWTDKGVVASLATFAWARQDNDAWAPQVVERRGKFYLYVPISVAGWPKNVIAVAVADRPEGPFKDALGKPLIDKADGFIDPTVFVDDDGQAYLYWGNPKLWYVKLNEDMVSYAGAITQISPTPTDYQEGPWFYKRQGRYYMAYASTCCPEGIGYAMSDKPTGPWTYKGHVMDHSANATGNHPGIIDFLGASYVFGFNYELNFADTPIHRERRSVTVARLDYAADGTIQMLPWWDAQGVAPLKALDPYTRVEAETIAWTSRIKRSQDRPFTWAAGLKTAHSDKVGIYVTRVADLSYIKVNRVDFGRPGASRFTANVASEVDGGQIELRLDSLDGPHVGTLRVSRTGGWDDWQLQSVPVSGAAGTHDLFLVFRGRGDAPLMNLDHWRFSR
ncbi:MAG: carbohydrate-binding protein [Rubrivivax sp.]|nr:MAG: carbohydrate-binding protein [Rubrivivax sp.]